MTLLLLVCTLLTPELTLASYGGNNLLNLIIRPAGRSRSFKWLGRGDVDHIPYVPRPVFIPHWVPKGRPEYVARWVPTTPPPYSAQPPAPPPPVPGFGAPKANSIAHGDLGYSASPPAPRVVPKTPTYAPVAPSDPTGYAPPHAGDIITKTPHIAAAPPLLAPPPPVSSYSQPSAQAIPETAIRNSVSVVPSVSALVQNEGVYAQISDFRPVDPTSVIIVEGDVSPGVLETAHFGNSVDSSIKDDTLVIQEPATPTATVLVDTDIRISPTINPIHERTTTVAAETSSFIFIIDPEEGSLESALPSVTSTVLSNIITENEQTSEGNSGKSLVSVSPTILSSDLKHPDAVTQESGAVFISEEFQPEIVDPAIFIQDQSTAVLDNEIQNEKNEFQPSQAFDTSQDLETIGGFRPNPEFASSSDTPAANAILVVDDTPEFNPEINESSELLVEFSQNIHSAPEYNENLGPNPEFNVNFSPSPEFNENFQSSSGNFQPAIETPVAENLVISPTDSEDVLLQASFEFQRTSEDTPGNSVDQVSEDTVLTARVASPPQPSDVPALPVLVAPPVSPPLITGRSISDEGPLTLGSYVPQPVPVPIAPLSVTLDFPRDDYKRVLRQGRNLDWARSDFRVLPQRLPFGARLQPRPPRRYRSWPPVFP